MQPLVSILIPAYNAERWIADTIHSALAQTWRKKEIIIVDDGSRDQTLRVARHFASDNVSVVAQENQGASKARNKAFELCQGDYIQWLDADDLLSPDKIAKQMEAAEEGESKRTVLSSAWGYFTYRRSKANFSPTSLWCDHSPVEWLLRKMEQSLHMQTATWLMSRELAEAAGPWDTRLSLDDDGEYFCRVVLTSNGIRFVPDVKVFYRQSSFGKDSLSNIDWSDKKLESHFLSMQLQINHLRSFRDDERVRAACVNYMQTWLICFYPERSDIVKQLERIAASLGGQLKMPRLRWKYVWIRKIFGYGLAKRAQTILPKLKSDLITSWDKVLFRLENRFREKAS
jgi:glycosyltransferase involved in cell wall biosynthesis